MSVKYQVKKRGVLLRSLNILPKRDQVLMSVVVGIQVCLALLDLIGVIVIGIIGSLAVTGVSANKPGTRVQSILKFLNLENESLQRQVMYLGAIAAILMCFKSIINLYFIRRTAFYLSRRAALISKNMIEKLLNRDLQQLNSRSLMETIHVLTNGVTTITVSIIGVFVSLISDLALLIILGVGLFVVDTVIALSTLLLFSTIAIVLYRFLHKKVRKLGNDQNSLTVGVYEKIGEVVNSYREVFVRDRRSYYANLIGRNRMDLANSLAESSYIPNLSKYLIELSLVMGILVVSAYQFSTQSASHAVAVLSIFLAASTRIAPAVLRLQQGLLVIKGNTGIAVPALELLEEMKNEIALPSIKEKRSFEHLGFKAQINLENVKFSYDQSKIEILKNVSLEIIPGSSVAIVGPSGAGKTTLVDIMLGLLPPSQGRCSISGLKPLDAIRKWPGSIAYVPQDISISNGTIASNIALGFDDNNLNENELWRALEIAHLREFVEGLPKKLNTYVGDRGKKLSGGQRQRLGIARAMYTNPKLLIMDEATSSLDGEVEAAITQSIQELKGKITILTIAHRLATIRNCDEIIYLESGCVLARGTFDQVKEQVPNFKKAASLMGL